MQTFTACATWCTRKYSRHKCSHSKYSRLRDVVHEKVADAAGGGGNQLRRVSLHLGLPLEAPADDAALADAAYLRGGGLLLLVYQPPQKRSSLLCPERLHPDAGGARLVRLPEPVDQRVLGKEPCACAARHLAE
jgi:hypothetical protein